MDDILTLLKLRIEEDTIQQLPIAAPSNLQDTTIFLIFGLSDSTIEQVQGQGEGAVVSFVDRTQRMIREFAREEIAKQKSGRSDSSLEGFRWKMAFKHDEDQKGWEVLLWCSRDENASLNQQAGPAWWGMKDEQDRIICPQSQERLIPERVWDSKTAGPGQTPQRLGTFKKHHHHREECPWSGLPVVVEREQKKE